MIGRGLPANPFSAARFAPGVIPWMSDDRELIARYIERAAVPGAAYQVVGAHGSGKSTLLAHLEAQARRDGIAVLRFRGSRGIRLASIWELVRRSGKRLLLVDEIEELSAAARLFLRAIPRFSGVSLVISAHRDHGLATLLRCRVDAALARRVIEHLVAVCPTVAVPSIGGLQARLARHDENLRELLFELYDDAEIAQKHHGHR